MPIEIRELVIKTTIVEKEEKTGGARLSKAEIDKLKKEIMNACLQKVMTELQKEKER